MHKSIIKLFSSFLLISLVWPALLHAWPSDKQWIELVKGGLPIQDAERDANGGVNIVPSNGTHAAAYLANDGTYLFYRLRLDATPAQGGNGILSQFGWGFELDTDQDADDYEWLMMCDGITYPEVVSLQKNTVQLDIGQPSDKTEIVVANWPLIGNHRILPADTSINGDLDYFLDFRIPLAVFKAATGITDNTLVRYFAGSSRSTNNLTDNGADLVAGSTLYEGLSDYITISGTLPAGLNFYNGTVRFTTDLGGVADQTMAAPGDTLYLRVDDLDLNTTTLPGGKLRVELRAPSGDVEIVDLNATGVSGKYTGSIPTLGQTSFTARDGVLQVVPQETVTVTYLDAVAANRSQNVPRTDTIILTTTGTDVGVSKTVDNPTPKEGDTVNFTVTISNLGPSTATGLQVTELLPAGLLLVSATPSQGSFDGSLWTVGTLARGLSATLTIAMQVPAGSNGLTLTNTATVTGLNQNDGNPANNSASATIRIGGTDLRVTKTVSEAYPSVGETIQYTVKVRNLGPTATTGVVVTDLIPAGLTLNSAVATQGSYNSGNGQWSVGNLPLGAAADLTLTATVNTGTYGWTITNTAALTASGQPDINSANDRDSAEIRVDFLDLGVSKTVSNAGPNINTDITYTVTLTNFGPNDATGVVVTDLLPAGVTYQSHSAAQGTYVSSTGRWTIGTVPAGASLKLQITARVAATAAGQTITNEAFVSACDQPDSNPVNNTGAALIAVGGTDIELSKSVSNRTPNPGNRIVWTVTVRNNGPNPATGVAITDIPPDGVSYVSYSASAGSYDAGKQNSSWVWTVGNLAVGASATLTITTDVKSGTAGQNITNLAMLTAAGQPDTNDNNNIAAAVIAVAGTDLGIVKTVNNPAPDVGQTIVYTLTARNNGPNAAAGVVVTDLLPPEVVYQSHSGPGSYNPATGLWTVGSLANGASAALAITALVRNEDHQLVITNRATIGSPSQGDPNPANDSASVNIYVAAVDLALAKTVNIANPPEQSSVAFTITVTNIGSAPATGIEIEDILPAGLTYIAAQPSQGIFGSSLWLAGTVAPGASATLRLFAAANTGTAGTTITNTARLRRVDQQETYPGNNSASASIIPAPYVTRPNITLVKTVQPVSDPASGTASPFAVPGAVMLYTITASNHGDAATDAGSVVISDRLPADTDLLLNNQPVVFLDGSNYGGAASGVTFSYGGLGDPNDSLSFATAAGDCAAAGGGTYIPSPVDGIDEQVRQICFTFGGAMKKASGAAIPEFQIKFMVKIR